MQYESTEYRAKPKLVSMINYFPMVLPLVFGLSFPLSAYCGKPPGISAGEMSLLPAYCKDTMGMLAGADSGQSGPNAAYWYRNMGESFRTMHHYCWALISMRRAGRAGISPANREALLFQATGDLDYVISNSQPNFVLLPEVLVTLGDVQALRKQYDQSVLAYYAARQTNPTYPRSYINWANLLNSLGDRKAAMTLLEDGMKSAPNEQSLRDQYKRLGGDPGKFAPKTPPIPSAASAAEKSSGTAAAPDAAASGSVK